MEFISGESRGQVMTLPDCIDDYITDNNSVRVIEAYINSLDLAALGCSRQQPNTTGRPMYDPKDLLKLYLYGYMNRIRSSRRLETESKRNVELLWLLGKLCPDHKTIAEFRRQNGEALKKEFKGFVKLCVKLGLYGKELLAIDGSRFKAVNSKERNYTEGKLKERIERLDTKIEGYMKELEEADREVLCPMGQVLRPAFYKKREGKGVFVNREVCKGCTCRCTKETRGKRHEVPMAEAAFSTSCNDRGLSVKQVRIHGERGIVKERKSIVEHPFGTIKRAMEAGYCLMKGKEQVSGEFARTFRAYNLNRAINILGVGTLLKAIAS
jgi:transposase